VRDILHLRGVDMGIVQSDVMAYFKQNGDLGANVDERLAYITTLYNEEMHLVASADIKDIKDLAGKKVNFAEVGSGTQFSSRLIFGFLGLKVEEVNMGQTDALVKVKSGEIAATVFIAGRPASVFAKLPKDPGLKLLPVPYTNELEANDYFPSTLSSQDYPGLIPQGQSVDTIGVYAVLATYNWPSNHDRYRRTANFTEALFSKIAEFQKPPRHPKWKEVNLAATLTGWKRFPAAQQWLDGAAAPATAPSARYSFIRIQRERGWPIVNHHSSVMPEREAGTHSAVAGHKPEVAGFQTRRPPAVNRGAPKIAAKGWDYYKPANWVNGSPVY
jgi:TRAP transporter TAXI family solute receptor